jgi:hypothetical protein
VDDAVNSIHSSLFVHCDTTADVLFKIFVWLDFSIFSTMEEEFWPFQTHLIILMWIMGMIREVTATPRWMIIWYPLSLRWFVLCTFTQPLHLNRHHQKGVSVSNDISSWCEFRSCRGASSWEDCRNLSAGTGVRSNYFMFSSSTMSSIASLTFTSSDLVLPYS